jgi:hypothetical protein
MKRIFALITVFISVLFTRIPSAFAQSEYAFWFSREGVDVYSRWSCASCDDRHIILKVVNNNPYKINWSYQSFIWKDRLGNVVKRESGGKWSIGAGRTESGDIAGWYFYPPEGSKGKELSFSFIDWKIERDGEEEERRKKEEEERNKKLEEEKKRKEDEQKRKEDAARIKEEKEKNDNLKQEEEEEKKQEQAKIREQKENNQLEQSRKAEEQRIKEEQTRQQNLARTQEELRKREESKRAEEKERQARVAANTAAVTAGFMALGGSILGADIAPEFCDSPSFLLEGNFGFMGSSVPALENVYSFRKQNFKDYSQSETMLGLGLSANAKVWPYRSLNFGIAGTGSIFYHLPIWEDGVNLFSYSLGGRSVIGHENVKAVVDLGITKRIGSSFLSSDQTIYFSNGTYAINNVFTEQKFNYLSNKLGLGLMIEYDAEEGEQVYYTFMVTREMLDFVKTSQPYYSFKAEIRCFLDLEIEYAQNYPIAGLPGYAYKQDGRNKDFFQVSFGIPMGLLVNY